MFEASAPRTASTFTLSRHHGASLADTRLATLPFLSDEERAALTQCSASRRTVDRGVELITRGHKNDTIYFLETGWACQHITTGDARRQITALLLPGDICNLDALLIKRLDSDVQMITDATVLAVPLERVASLVADYPGIARAFIWLGAIENAILARRTFCLGRLSGLERTAHLLCELAVRLGLGNDKGEVSFQMALTQEQLGDALGLTPVHVNRMLLELRTTGLVASTKHLVVIPDIAALRQAGEFQPAYLQVPAHSAPAEIQHHFAGETR